MTDPIITVSELLDIFQEGLLGLIPSAERASIGWRDDNPHDDWESLAEAVFVAYVTSPLYQAPLSREAHPLPRYDFDYLSYETFSWIESNESTSSISKVFVRLLSKDDPFDTAQWVDVDPATNISGERSISPLASSAFRLRQRFIDGRSQLIEQVELKE